jgi:hypothetical protein
MNYQKHDRGAAGALVAIARADETRAVRHAIVIDAHLGASAIER